MILQRSDLQFDYPEELLALVPQRPSRVMWVDVQGEPVQPEEMAWKVFLEQIPPGDVLVVNNTRVLKRRVYAGDLEILFLSEKENNLWEVLFPSKDFSLGDEIKLPWGIKMKLIRKGRPQLVKLSSSLPEEYFEELAELPIPPYIQKARGERHSRLADHDWYQTPWATCPGSLAAPTASLHFSQADIQELKNRGVHVLDLTLHVGLGTFLPVLEENLKEHPIHSEFVRIPASTWQKLLSATQEGHAVWALGTTVARALESAAHGLLGKNKEGDWEGLTQLFIQPGFQWKVVERLLTNFHQPESTLLALVAGFSSLDQVKSCYAWAVQRKFRLFSYGDLTAWIGGSSLERAHRADRTDRTGRTDRRNRKGGGPPL